MKKVLSLCSALLGKGMAAGLILLASHALAPLQMFAQDRNISLDIREQPLSEALEAIEKQSDYEFFFNNKLVNTDRVVSVSISSEDIRQILDKLLAATDIKYEIKGTDIILSKEDTSRQEVGLTVGGVISDESGAPVPYVYVMEKGTSNYATTDENGGYTITVSGRDAVLTFSLLGYADAEQTVGSRSRIDVTLHENINMLDDVVVVGFGTQKKVNLTGSVAAVSSDQLKDRPVSNLQQALQGLVPGLNISQSTGFIDSTPSFNIRGIGSISSASSAGPLVLIDGVEGDITNLNPQDVESISVLKDAAASSIYGSRAAFGVIMITTKKGESGTVKVNYYNNFKWSSPVVVPEPMDSYTLTTYVNDACDNANSARFFTDEHVQRIKDYQDGKITTVNIPDPANPTVWGNPYYYGNANNNFYDVLYKDWQFSQEHNFNVSGGNDKFTFYASIGYLDQNGLLKITSDNYKRYTPMLSIDAQVTPWMKIIYTTRFIRRDYDYPRNVVQGLYDNWGRQSWSYLPIYDDNGYFAEGGQVPAIVLGGRVKNQVDNYNNHGSIVLEPIKNWVTTFDINYNISSNQFKDVALPANYKHDVAGNLIPNTFSGQVEERNTKENFFNINLYTSYKFDIRDSHNFTVMAGMQLEELKYKYTSMSRMGLLVEDLQEIDMTTGMDYYGEEQEPVLSGNSKAWSTAGFFGRINYDYLGRYLFEANLRYDGTSRFRADQRWNWFPSFSIGWNIAKESFWGNLDKYVNLLKLRASYGMLGNQNTNSWYPTYEIMNVETNAGSWLQNGQKPNVAYSPELISSTLTWEKVNTFNVGLDAGAFNNRLSLSFDYYIRETLDMVGPSRELPDVLGKTPPPANNTNLRTNGFDLEIGWKDALKNGFQYSAKFVLSDNYTIITKYPNQEKLLSLYYEGQMYGDFWGYETIGIAKTDEEMQQHLASLPNGGQDALGSNWAAGDIMYKDLNGDGKINNGSDRLDDHGDLKVIGNSSPRYQFGLDLNAGWKGFDLRLFFQGVGKRDFYTNSPMFFGIAGNGLWTMVPLVQHLDYFRAEPSGNLDANTDAYYPRPLISGFRKNQQWQSRYVIDASYIRLKNITLGYTLPSHITKKFFVSNLRVYVSGENLLTFTKVPKMYDPETIGASDTYPLQKMITAGLSITF